MQLQEKELAALTDEELLAKRKKLKSTNIMNAVIFGVTIGIAIYSTVRNGFGLLTFFPVLFVPLVKTNSKNNRALETVLRSRNL
jgi:predicted permease